MKHSLGTIHRTERDTFFSILSIMWTHTTEALSDSEQSVILDKKRRPLFKLSPSADGYWRLQQWVVGYTTSRVVLPNSVTSTLATRYLEMEKGNY